MRIFDGLNAYDMGPCALAMGKFDGVHVGHMHLLDRTVKAARELHVPAVALTFDRHPSGLLHPDNAPAQLTDACRRNALIEKNGIDALIVCKFTQEFASIVANDFLAMLCETLHPLALVCGHSFTFGRGAEGTAKLVQDRAKSLGYRAILVDPQLVDGQMASSTRVRELIEQGDIAAAKRVLGHD